MTINMTNLTEAADFVDLMKYGNEVTAGIFGLLILLAIFVSFFGATRSTGTSDINAFTVGSFACALSSILLYLIGVVQATVVLIMIVLMLIPVLATIKFKSS